MKMGREHTNREYELELRKLREQILLMGAKVEEVIKGSIQALLDRDSELAQKMIGSDRRINQMELDTDEKCMQVLARRQPVASDLRFLTMTLKLVTDLERIGDLGVNICERVIELNEEPPLKPYVDLPRMAEEVQGMLREALDAFVAGDASRAEKVIARDQTIDAYYTQIFRELLTYMMEDPRNIYRATRLQSIAKYLERIGDHTTNIGEMVVFMVKGQDIRHTYNREIDPHQPDGATQIK
jgi:phosphate transport system protein